MIDLISISPIKETSALYAAYFSPWLLSFEAKIY